MAETTTTASAADNDKILAAVATLPVVGLIMFYAMKDASPIVKHYAKQSNAVLALHIVSSIVIAVLGAVFIGLCLGPILSIVAVVANVMLAIKAYNMDQKYVLPVVGDFFDTLLK